MQRVKPEELECVTLRFIRFTFFFFFIFFCLFFSSTLFSWRVWNVFVFGLGFRLIRWLRRYFCATQFKASFNVVCIASVEMVCACFAFCILHFVSFRSMCFMWCDTWQVCVFHFSFFTRCDSHSRRTVCVECENENGQQQIRWHYFSLSRKTIMQDMWFHYMQTVDKLQIFIASLCNSFFLSMKYTTSPLLLLLLLLLLLVFFLS